jgi:hypothetical protein
MATAETETTLQMKAASLWQFVHLKTPLFPHSAALDVVQKLELGPNEDLKSSAKRLRKELEGHRVKISHTVALEAAAKLAGFQGWHDSRKNQEPRPRLEATLLTPEQAFEGKFTGWDDIRPMVCGASETFVRTFGTRYFDLKLGRGYFMLSFPETVAGDDGPTTTDTAFLIVKPISLDDADWLEGADRLIEALRRRLEEPGLAFINGTAVAAFCENMTDAVNSELVVMDTEHDLDLGFEVARGDEAACWAQMEAAGKNKSSAPAFDEVTGAWTIWGRRFVVEVATIDPRGYIPGLTVRNLRVPHSAKLFRRYLAFKRHNFGALPFNLVAKNFQELSAPKENYRVDLHKLLGELNKRGLDWDRYCEIAGVQQEMQPVLPLGFLLALLKYLELPDPNALWARPSRSDLSKAGDLELIRALLPRTHHVRYRLTQGLPGEVKEAVREAVAELSGSILTRQMSAPMNFTNPEDQLPHLVFAYDADELVATLSANNLTVYAGMLPFLKPIEQAKDAPNLAPFEFGLSLFLDIDIDVAGDPGTPMAHG